jgi:hypothetical protein
MGSHAADYEELCSLDCNSAKYGESQSSEASLDFHENTRRYAPEYRILQEINCLSFPKQAGDYELFSAHSLAWFNPLRVSTYEKDLNHIQGQAWACW